MAATAPAPSPTSAPSSRPGLTTSPGAAMPSPSPSDLSFPQDAFPRLSVVTPTRLMLGTLSSALVGFSLGATQGGQMAQLRFRAEHAHKMPDTTTGWYFYHKSKNYHAMQGGIREGFRMGLKTGFWSLMALSLESTVDRYRGASDMFSTTIATLTVAGAFSLWHRLSLTTAARTARYGLMFGLAYGGIQDLVGLARGRPIGYVEALRRRGARTREDDTHKAL
ncbi:hypothetical protein BKA59DRAFT_276243 [Fusarium tricinctum]|uniref:Uncharacterized protein n=3 Tax=Fusarium tricinctum species complex TaxID=679429 RepID=A0A8K0RW08_9HYPO|nr:hypothetical protein BKA59DRAFT_276243 [Fusarium tricinctum]